MENFHEWLLGLGFICNRVFDEKYQQFRLDYVRGFFDSEIVVSPSLQVVPNDGINRMSPAEQVESFSDIEILKDHHLNEYHVWLTSEDNRVHLCVLNHKSELITLFNLCRVTL